MFTIIILVVVTLNGQNITSYERNAGTRFDTIEECRAFAKEVTTTFTDTGNFVFTVSGLCADRSVTEAYNSVHDRAARAGDKAVEILGNFQRHYDDVKMERRQQAKPPAQRQNAPQRNYLYDKSM